MGLIAACLGPPPADMARRAPAPAAAAARAGAQAALGSRLGSDAAAALQEQQNHLAPLPLPRVSAAAQLSARLGRFVPADAVDLLSRMLSWDPSERPSAREALAHPFLARHGVSASPSGSGSSSEGREQKQEAKQQQQQQPVAFEVSASSATAAGAATAPLPAPFFDVEAAPPPAAASFHHPLLQQQQQQKQLYEDAQEKMPRQLQEQRQQQEQREQQFRQEQQRWRSQQEQREQETQSQHRYTFFCKTEPAETVRIDHWTPRRKAEAAVAYARGVYGGGFVAAAPPNPPPAAVVAAMRQRMQQEAVTAGAAGGAGSESGGSRIRAHRSDEPIIMPPVPPRVNKPLAFPRKEEKQQHRGNPFAAGSPSSSAAFPPPPLSTKSSSFPQHFQRRLPRPNACPRADSDLAGAANALQKALEGDIQSSSSLFAAATLE